ncbi:MAG: hypothetical protein ACRDL6_07180 [Solirubrobacterales bacterium]
MAGIGTDTRSRTTLCAHRLLPAAVGAALLALALLLIGAGGAPAPAEAQVSCPPQPVGLSPPGPGPTRFTMLIRINTQGNIDDYANFNEAKGGLGGRIRSQDIFVLNTRFTGSNGAPAMTPSVAAELATNLRAAFPCNRIIALTGMNYDFTQPGYAFTLYDHPAIYALLTDFEPMDWNAGRLSDPSRPPWTQNYRKAFPRIKSWDRLMTETMTSNSVATGKRTGLVPLDDEEWSYGAIAQDLDKKNRRVGGRHLGPLSVQTQDSCAEGGPAGFGARAKDLRLQYVYKFKRKKVKRRKGNKVIKKTITKRRKIKKKGRPNFSNLSLQISFSNTPSVNGGMAITRTSASTAALCALAGLKQKGGAFFFFASSESMRVLLQETVIGNLRPPTT